jgi:hypothetical protein
MGLTRFSRARKLVPEKSVVGEQELTDSPPLGGVRVALDYGVWNGGGSWPPSPGAEWSCDVKAMTAVPRVTSCGATKAMTAVPRVKSSGGGAADARPTKTPTVAAASAATANLRFRMSILLRLR